jgi:hypothetical protein
MRLVVVVLIKYIIDHHFLKIAREMIFWIY